MRDENGFKCHVQSESHVRQMLVIGENPNKAISDYSQQFQRDFLQQLRTSHNTKSVLINRFYQDYISNKEHIHMNATKWKNLTEFAMFLGREGICRVQETDKGLEIAWVDTSPEALKRQDAIRKKERMDKGDEEREQKLISEQVERAQDKSRLEAEEDDEARALQRGDGEKISLNFGSKPAASKLPTPPRTSDGDGSGDDGVETQASDATNDATLPADSNTPILAEAPPPAVKMSFGSNSSKPKNVFAAKKNSLSGKKSSVVEPPKKISEAERIMKEEIERKRAREQQGGIHFGVKRQKVT